MRIISTGIKQKKISLTEAQSKGMLVGLVLVSSLLEILPCHGVDGTIAYESQFLPAHFMCCMFRVILYWR